MLDEVIRLLVAVAPILTVALALSLRARPVLAGLAGLGIAIAVSAMAFPISSKAALDAAVQIGPTVVEVAVIMLGGIGLAQVTMRTGAQGTIADWLARIESGSDRILTLLLLTFGVTPLMESLTGYGLGVVTTAPLLIHHGLTPAKAVLVGLLGLVLVPWGSLGPGTLIAATLGDVHFTALGVWSAILTLPVLTVSMILVVGLVVGKPSLRQGALALTVILIQWSALIGTNLIIGVPLAGVLSSASVIATLILLRRRSGPLPAIHRDLTRAIIPYAVIVAGILSSAALHAAFGAPKRWEWVAAPALWAVVAACISLVALGLPSHERVRIVATVLRRWLPVTSVVVLFMLLGIVMAISGTAEYLALAASRLGPAFVGLIPAIGALGGLLTGSNSGAAAMLSSATTAAAIEVGADPLIALACQNVAGSYAIIASPSRISLAVSVALPAHASLPSDAVKILMLAVSATAVLLGLLLLTIG